MEYLVNLVRTDGSTRIKRVEAESVKDAEKKAREKYSPCEVGRIVAATNEGSNYYNLVKRMKR